MHAGFPHIQDNFFHMLTREIPGHLPSGPLLDHAGAAISEIMALMVRDGLGILFEAKRVLYQEAQALHFIKEHLVLRDGAEARAFQGSYLIRTRQPGDNLNVCFRFCPDGAAVLRAVAHDTLPPVEALIETRALREEKADAWERDPAKVDLVIRFRDIPSVLALVGRPQVDVVGLLLQNTVQLTGNVGYLFKLGAIGKAIQGAMQTGG